MIQGGNQSFENNHSVTLKPFSLQVFSAIQMLPATHQLNSPHLANVWKACEINCEAYQLRDVYTLVLINNVYIAQSQQS